MPPTTRLKHLLFATCAPGVEPFLFDELTHLHVGNMKQEKGGISFTGTEETIVRVNLQSRIADRVLLRLGHFQATHLNELEKKTAALPLCDVVAADAPVFVNAICKKSKIYHSGAAAERIANAVAKAIKSKSPFHCQSAPGDAANSAASIQGRIVRDRVTISLDTSGEHLHKRGYRTHVTDAPLRENIAAAALRFCEYSGETPLVNPMCGSGTIAIEAALVASRTAPGINRQFAFETWPSFDRDTLQQEKKRAANYQREMTAEIAASDFSPEAVDVTAHNAEAAMMAHKINVIQREISQISLEGAPGVVIVNPPWGKRLGHAPSVNASVNVPGKSQLKAVYRKIGQLKKQYPDWTFCVIASDAAMAESTGIAFTKISAAIPMGGIRIKFYMG